MFEDFDEFGTKSKPNDGRIYYDTARDFEVLTKFMPIEEVGISFNGEIKIDETTSVITDKKVTLESPEVALKTYQKVMEMRDLTEAERTNVNKAKLILKKMFEIFFRGSNWTMGFSIFWSLMIVLDIYTDNPLGVVLMTSCILLNTSPIKFIKALNKILNKRKKEKLQEELSEIGLYSYIDSVDDAEDIKLYCKPKIS